MSSGTIRALTVEMEEPVTPRGEKKAPEDEPDPLVIRMPVDVRSLSLSILAGLALDHRAAVRAERAHPGRAGRASQLRPEPDGDALARYHLPRVVGAAVAVALLVGSIGVGVYTLSDEAAAIVASVPEAARRIRQRVTAQRSQRDTTIIPQVQEAAKEIEKTADAATTSPRRTHEPRGPDATSSSGCRSSSPRSEPPTTSGSAAWASSAFLGQFAVILFLVYFLLVTGDLYKRKLVKIAGPTLSKKRVTVQILDEINQQIESFIKVQFITSLVVAVATGLALWASASRTSRCGACSPGIFNSIPYLGPMLVTGGLAIVAFMQFNDVAKTLYVSGAAFVITSLEGFLLTPMMMGRAAQMNPVAIFVGLLFWSWVWGVWGTVLAVPMLMMIKAICDHIEDLQPIGELLGE